MSNQFVYSQQKIKNRTRKELINEQSNITFRNDDQSLMSISLANRNHNGKYECLATNSMGTTHSESVNLDIKCKF